MLAYKFTTQDMKTYNGFQWEIGKRYGVGNKGAPKLCTPTVFHAYETDLLAALLNPIHANIKNPRIFVVDCEPVVGDGTKLGSRWMQIKYECDLPRPTLETRVAFGILCAAEVCTGVRWREWARKWLSGEDRSISAADAAYAAYTAYTAYTAAAAYAAADAACAAAYAADAAAACAAACAAAYAAAYAADAAVAYAYAYAYVAAKRGIKLGLLAERAFQGDWTIP